ncbi:MAG: hypothetical protein P8090_08465 [Gammaproteobacteria bacterium]
MTRPGRGNQQQQGAQSVARRRRGVTVAPSPLNGVKLELAVGLCVVLMLWAALDRWTSDWLVQAGVLAGGAVMVAAWIVLRAHRVMRRHGAGADRSPADVIKDN